MIAIDRMRLTQAAAIAAACVLLAGCPGVTTQSNSPVAAPTSTAPAATATSTSPTSSTTTSTPSTSSTTSTPPTGSTTTSAPPVTGSATLSWTAPAVNTDGSILNDLAGYYVEYGNSASALTQTVDITGAANTNTTINNLSAGTYYFAVVAYSSLGTESAPSPTVSKTI